jgi:uncharacterized membrane protein
MPVLHNHDEEFHFDECCMLTNAVVKRSAVDAGGGNDNEQFRKYSAGGFRAYARQYFKKKVPQILKHKVEDRRALHMQVSDILLHLVPAIGVKLGAMIYPSVGVMCVVGRLFSCLFYALTLFFIIKFLNYGKAVFVMVALTPTMLTSAASLSYDCTNFVIISFFIALIINLSISTQVSKKMWYLLVISSLLVYFSKENSRLLLLLLFFLPFRRFQNLAFFKAIYERILALIKRFKIILSTLFVGVVGIFSWNFFKSVGGVSFAFHKFINTFIFYAGSKNYPENKSLAYLISNIIDGGLWDQLSIMPSWWSVLWYILFWAILLAEGKKFEKKRQIFPLAMGSFCIYFLNYFGVIAEFILYLPQEMPFIIGPQGRYFTPFLPLFAITAQAVKTRFIWKEKWLKACLYIFLFLSLGIYTIIIFSFAYQNR